MKRKVAYIFLDWYMTINELISNEKINEKFFHSFVSALNNMQTELNCDINLVVLSGTSANSAMKCFSILDEAFKEKKDEFLKGFAYEYGGFLIFSDGKIKRYYNKKTTLNGKIDELCEKYNVSKCQDCELYYYFKFEHINKQVLSFVKDCKDTFADKDFEFFNDKYGKGLDIKNRDLNKHEFITKYLKNKKIDLLVIGGDSVQDEIMFEKSTFPNKYFLGFKKFTKSKPNYILSSKSNILGVIEDINVLTHKIKDNKVFD